jgi:hypothetical protein
MTVYEFALGLGGIGLLAMAVLGRAHGRGHSHGHAHGLARGHSAAAARHGGGTGAGHGAGAGARQAANLLATLASPRTLFSLLIGFGATGALLGHLLAGPALVGSAVLGALGFERVLVTPLWNLMMRFASEPAQTLDQCVTDIVEAVTPFDAAGQGIVAVELDGQITQILATLRPEDRTAGVHIHTGDRLRVEDVDSARNRCTVSLVPAS